MKVLQTTSWKWRRDELSLKQFRQLTSTEREEYLFLLKGLDINILGTNDEYILTFYTLQDKPKQEHFIKL